MDQVNTQATFAQDDKFERVRYAKMCMKLIANHPADRGACTIAVDAPWGVGKSTFLWMWINALIENDDILLDKKTRESAEATKQVLPIYYNAWESDFCDNALAPLLYSICAMVDKKKDEGLLSPEDEGLIKKVVSGACGLLATIGVKLHGGNDLMAQAAGFTAEATATGIMNLLAARSRTASDEPKPGSIGAAYDQQLKDRDQFREALSELAQKFGGVYIFIDELDRCKPSFAIDTLDTIKHYFDIPGLTFIFGVDMLQLGHAISGRYGFNYDAEGYLSKFFEHHIALPTPTAEQMLSFCGETLYLNAESYKRLDDIFRACKVSPREIPRIVRANKTLTTLLCNSIGRLGHATEREFLFLLISLKYRLNTLYTRYVSGHTDWNILHWNESHSFWPIISYFSSFMKKSVSDCQKEWDNILTSQSKSTASSDNIQDFAAVGKALIYCTHPYGYETFGQCVIRFMEQVHI